MNGTLYRIFNTVNNKSYIGKTYLDPYKRLSEHIRDAKRFSTRPLYKAFSKYGIEVFSMEILGQYPENILEEEEIKAIIEYNSYGKTGYNATKGGDGAKYLDLPEKEIVNSYASSTIINLAKKYKVDHSTIRKILISNNVLRDSKNDPIFLASRTARAHKILLIDTNEIYTNRYECAKALIAADVVDSELSIDSIEKGISKVCGGSRSSYKGLKFKYYMDE